MSRGPYNPEYAKFGSLAVGAKFRFPTKVPVCRKLTAETYEQLDKPSVAAFTIDANALVVKLPD